ncbi:bifunctional 3'-5' exonuclease/DNA polymerase [Microbacterium sp. W1N]|uniref:bifunctional 3'-5' exonuclease/DNA polymerase n=1 Tax=Microbacterium festucae TaxID=2977531 RepID=UPI0021BEBD9A|nr:bifunctional 3'-5' exonuclease/DNA polymerase [Microbacterium festucae]MCT9820047.1 bifunctional 3'-5' exonuclease/DNA polymerase [Microbacterium festucae]
MTTAPRWRVVGRGEGGAITVVDLDRNGDRLAVHAFDDDAFRRAVAADAEATRWVWHDTRWWYRMLLDAGIRISRCHDLRLSHAILRTSAWADAPALRAARGWDAGGPLEEAGPQALFDLDGGDVPVLPESLDEVLAEFERQREAVTASPQRARLELLLAAESAGALVAEELHAAGVPWSREVHAGILDATLGPRPLAGGVPARIAELGAVVRAALGDDRASLDSQPKLLRALHRAGVPATSTNRWELAEYDHPVIAPLLEYKKLTRLASANGWAWLEEWAPAGRFRPVYVPGGVVTGRWASSGGGALQLPRQLRPAVRADPGWTLVVADVAQLEPRVLAAMAGDTALAAAARGTDLYAGMVGEGVVTSRQEAKIAMLGAMYGATTGDSGRLVPALRRAYPRAMGLVDEAAAVGEAGGVVTTWLGRSSPAPGSGWQRVQQEASGADASAADETRARRSARDRGRFTRNFVVQGSAAEWALAWLADLRTRLAALPVADAPAPASGPVFAARAHLAFFLHDEIIVHAPQEQAEAVAVAVREAADAATRLLFGGFPLDFPLDLQIRADAAKG